MGKTKLDETYIFKSALKCDSFDVAIGTEIPFFRVLVTIEPGRSLLQFVTTNCLTIVKDCKNDISRTSPFFWRLLQCRHLYCQCFLPILYHVYFTC